MDNDNNKDNTPVGGEDNNIFRFRNKQEILASEALAIKKLTADEVLTQIINDGDVQDVLVIGWGDDEDIHMFSSTISTEKAVHGLECAKQTILLRDMGL